MSSLLRFFGPPSRRSLGTDRHRSQTRSCIRSAASTYVAATVVAAALACAPNRAAATAVLYTTESREDTVAAYEIRDDGRLAATPFQRVSVAANPRRLLATSRALYVAGKERVEALRIDPETGCLSWFRFPPSTKTRCPRFLEIPSNDDEDVVRPARVKNAGFQYLAVDPAERYLYAAATNKDRILGYPIAADGSIDESASCTQGKRNTRYQGLATTDTMLYVAAARRGRVRLFPLRASDGAIQAFTTNATCDGGPSKGNACVQDSDCRDKPSTCSNKGMCKDGPDEGLPCVEDSDCADRPKYCVNQGVCRDGPDEGITCTEDADCPDDSDCPDGTCTCDTDRSLEVFTDCDRDTVSFAAHGTSDLRRPQALLLNRDDQMLYITDIATNRIIACPLGEDGTLPDCPKTKYNPDISKTNSGEEYEQLALSPDNVLYASVFINGDVRAFVLKDGGQLPRNPKQRYPADIFATPVGLMVYGDVLYVATGDLNRIGAFRIDETGFRNTRAFSYTAVVDRSFPNDVAIVPVSCPGCAP